MPLFDIKLSILLKLHQFIGQKKSTKCPFFPIFHNKDFSHAHILLKNIYSLKNTLFMCIYYVKKFLFSQKPNALFSFFFQIYYEKPQLSCPHLVNKTSIQTKLHYIMGKKVNKMPFFPIFLEKNNALMPIFYPKTSIL